MVAIWRGDRELIIAGHEAEDLVAENADVLKD
jgi:C4-dicarboxylate transporter DctQ subunit